MKTLAIEREAGSGGKEIGMEVAKTSGIAYYDCNLLIKAAERYHISLGKLKDYEKRFNSGQVSDILAAADEFQNRSINVINDVQDGVKETIKCLEKEGPAVFVGHCATEVLKYRPNVVRVFLYSSNEMKKIKRIAQNENITEEEARIVMERLDRNRAEYFRFFTEQEWKDRNNYDLELNTGMLSNEECKDILLHIMG